MRRTKFVKRICLYGICTFYLPFSLFSGENITLKSEPVNYCLDFENETKNGRPTGSGYKINFAGVTEEKAFSGKKSFKLDVTLSPGYSILEYNFPLGNIPGEGKLKLSGYFLVEETISGKAGLGVYAILHPSRDGGAACISATGPTKGKWILLEMDPVKYANSLKSGNWTWGAANENFSSFIQGICITIESYGLKETRVVAYIDDLKLSGETPDLEQYKSQVSQKWAPAAEKIQDKFLSWNKAIQEINTDIQSVKNEQIKKELLEMLTSIQKTVGKFKSQGFFPPSSLKEISISIERLQVKILKVKNKYRSLAND